MPSGEGRTDPVRRWARNRDSGAGLSGEKNVGPPACGLPVELSTARDRCRGEIPPAPPRLIGKFVVEVGDAGLALVRRREGGLHAVADGE